MTATTPASVAACVRNRVRRSRNRFWRPADFDGSRAAVEQALLRLVDSDDLTHLRRGLYWRGTKTPLGMAPPPVTLLAKAVAAEPRGMGPAAASAANALGLSTQIPRLPVFAVAARVPESMPSAIALVSRAACRARVRVNPRAAEVALLEVLRDWNALVETDDAEARRVVRSHFACGALRPDVLAKVAGTEPAPVPERLAELLADCGYEQAAATVGKAPKTHAIIGK
ncbi:MAG: DUF6088 family protein [Streptosporangiaceae bacterium]